LVAALRSSSGVGCVSGTAWNVIMEMLANVTLGKEITVPAPGAHGES
jgi:hypothetical protein